MSNNIGKLVFNFFNDVRNELQKTKKSSVRIGKNIRNDYYSLDSILSCIRKGAFTNKLSYFYNFFYKESGLHYEFTLTDIDTNETIFTYTSAVPILFGMNQDNSSMNSLQKIGSTFTYLNRYMLLNLLGYAPVVDLDGEDFNGKVDDNISINLVNEPVILKDESRKRSKEDLENHDIIKVFPESGYISKQTGKEFLKQEFLDHLFNYYITDSKMTFGEMVEAAKEKLSEAKEIHIQKHKDSMNEIKNTYSSKF